VLHKITNCIIRSVLTLLAASLTVYVIDHFMLCMKWAENYKYYVTFTVSTVKQTRCTIVSNLFYFGMTLYMFRTVFPSLIRSSRLYIEQQAFVKQILLSAYQQVDSTICLTKRRPVNIKK